MTRTRALLASIAFGMITTGALAEPFARGMSLTQRAVLGPLRVLTVVVQDELGAQYSTRSTTAKLLDTAQISGIAFDIDGTLYIGPAPDSMTPWIDTSAYLVKDAADLPSVAAALDPGKAIQTATKIALAPILRSTERSEHGQSGREAYARIAPARAALKGFDVLKLLHDDAERALAEQPSLTVASHNTMSAWPTQVLAQAGMRETPLLLLFTQYALAPDLRTLEVRTEAMLLRPADAADSPVYRQRFVYLSPRLPLPGKPFESTDAGSKEGAKRPEWTRAEMAQLLLDRWLAHEGALLKAELSRASAVTARDLAADLTAAR